MQERNTNGKQTHISNTFVKIIVKELTSVRLPIHVCGVSQNNTGVEYSCTDRRFHSIKIDEKKGVSRRKPINEKVAPLRFILVKKY